MFEPTINSDVLDLLVGDGGHEAEDGEDDEAGEDAGAAVDERDYDSVPTRITVNVAITSLCYRIF